jgi:sugar lactone lactonase YvrE
MYKQNSLNLVFIVGLAISMMACTPLHNNTKSRNLPSMENPLNGMGEVTAVASGFISTEGPVWHSKSNSLIFTDIPQNTIYSLEADTNKLSILRKPTETANGLALDIDGHLLAAEQTTRIISRMNLTTSEVEPFITHVNINGVPKAFNSPNDMAIYRDGSIFFTDPPFGLRGRESDLDFNGVFVLRTSGELETLKKLDVDKKPNGIIFNPDQSILYLAISHDVSGPILAYDVDSNGVLSNEREFYQAQNTDGLAMDQQGNLYVATRTGVEVISSSGQRWGKIVVPNTVRTTNGSLGGTETNTLYITNRSSELYAIKLNTVGHQ